MFWVLPQTTELRLIRSQVAALPPGLRASPSCRLAYWDRRPRTSAPTSWPPVDVAQLRLPAGWSSSSCARRAGCAGPLSAGRLADLPVSASPRTSRSSTSRYSRTSVDGYALTAEVLGDPWRLATTRHRRPGGRAAVPARRATGPARLCVVVPVFNEARSSPDDLARTRRGSRHRSTTHVDRSSSSTTAARDDTVERPRSLAARDSASTLPAASRATSATRRRSAAGLDQAEGDLVITMDGDLQHPPELLPVLVERGAGLRRRAHEEAVDRGPVAVARLATGSPTPAIGGWRRSRSSPRPPTSGCSTAPPWRADRAPERHRLYRGLTPWIGFRQAVVPYEAPARRRRVALRPAAAHPAFTRSFFDFSNAPLHVGIVMGGVTVRPLLRLRRATPLVAYLAGHAYPTAT